MLRVGDGREEFVERLDCHAFTLSCKRADQPHFVLCLSALSMAGAARGFLRAARTTSRSCEISAQTSNR